MANNPLFSTIHTKKFSTSQIEHESKQGSVVNSDELDDQEEVSEERELSWDGERMSENMSAKRLSHSREKVRSSNGA